MSAKEPSMDSDDRKAAARARSLWEEAGKPSSGPGAYVDRARELIAIEEHQKDTLKPTGAEPQENAEDDPIASPDVFGPEGEPVEPVLPSRTQANSRRSPTKARANRCRAAAQTDAERHAS
jgi:hypothetical protein